MVINDGNPIYSYDHPFNQTIINDNTVSKEAVITIPDRVNYMCVFVGGKGRDNKLIKQTTRSGFVSEFGKPDALKYGQPVLNAWSSIVDSYSHAYCMRVMPTDACYANIIVSLKYKVTDDGLATKVVAESVGGLNDVSKFSSIMDSKIEDSPDAEGYKTTPLFGIVSKGRGKYGNSYRIRLTPVSSKKANQVYKFYRLELLDIDEGNTVVEAFEGTLYDYAINSISYLMSDVADGETSGSTKITIYNNEEAIEKIFTEYQLAAPSDKDMTYLLIKENKKPMNTPTIFRKICDLLGYNDDEYSAKIGDYYTSLTIDKRFVLLDSNEWDIRDNHSIDVSVEDEDDEEDEDETTEEEQPEDEEENIDEVVDDDLDEDDELEDLAIIDEEELED